MTPLPPALIAGLMCFAALTDRAAARLGETREQCEKRYGMPVSEVPPLLDKATAAAYSLEGIRVRIEFIDDRAVWISFSRRGMLPEERQALLEKNSGSLVWNPPGDFLGRTFWTARGTVQEPARHASGYQLQETGFLDMATEAWTRAMARQQEVQFAIPVAEETAGTPLVPGLPSVKTPETEGKLGRF